jgi:hypothetical protein
MNDDNVYVGAQKVSPSSNAPTPAKRAIQAIRYTAVNMKNSFSLLRLAITLAGRIAGKQEEDSRQKSTKRSIMRAGTRQEDGREKFTGKESISEEMHLVRAATS